MGEFGDKFRKAREKKGISLDDVSNVTKISSRMLQAIEGERFDQLPGGVFNKGFIRAYARHVGLNDEDAVNEYLACLRQAQIDAQAVWEPSAASGKDKRPRVEAHQIAANQAVAGQVSRPGSKSETAQEQSGGQVEELPDLQLPRVEHVRRARREYSQRGKALPWRPVVITLLLLITAGVVWQRHVRHARAEGKGITAVAVSESAPQLVQASGSGSDAIQASPSSTEVSRTEPGKVNGRGAGTRPSNAAAKPAVNPDDEDESASSSDAANTPPVPKSPARFTLVIHADENSWISVTADGQPVSHETLIAPADTSIRANREIVAHIGNAAGVSFIWNGQEIQPQGAEAEVKTFVFDTNGMRALAAPQNPTQPQ